VGKTHLASALGHIAVSRKHRVLSLRADQMLKKLKAARLDQTLELRKLLRVDLLIIDDLALQPLDRPRPRTSTRSSSNTIRCPRRS
jgi:DNA replication protein DnaC